MAKLLPIVVMLAMAVNLAAGIGPSWYSCDPATCTGNCHCPSITSPGGLSPADTPQFILITHDDAITPLADTGVRSITDGHKNPNGCNVPATWFTTSTGTDCNLAKKLFDQNHEIALHTMRHAELVPAAKNMEEEIMGAKRDLEKCGIPKEAMVGFRSPYLIHNPLVRGILSKNGLLYDSSMNEFVGALSKTTNSFGQRLWPYTMDFGIAQDCNWTFPSGQCDVAERYPSMFEVPMWDLPNDTVSTEKNAYTMDYGAGFGGDLYTTLTTNFDQAYNGNRAPFPFYVHAPWFTDANIAATNKFFDYALSKPNVFFVTMQQMLDWIKNPVPASQVGATLKCNPVDLTPPEKLRCQLYTVQSGDFADLIAGKFGIVDTKELINLNPTAIKNIQPGLTLKIPPWDADCGAGVPAGTKAPAAPGAATTTVPAPDAVTAAAPVVPAAPVVDPSVPAAACVTWTVGPGQYLTIIAEQAKADIAEIIRINALSGATAPLTPGQVLKIPPFADCCATNNCSPTAEPVVSEVVQPVVEAQPLPAAEVQPQPQAQTTSEMPPSRVELYFNLQGMSPTDFEANTRSQFAITLAQLLKVPQEMVAVGVGARRRHSRALQQDPVPTARVLAVVSTADPATVYNQAQIELQNGDMDSMLNALGLSPQGPPVITAFKDGVAVEVAPGAIPAAAATPAAPTSSGPSVAIIAGAAAGGVVVIIAAVVTTVLCVRRRRARALEKKQQEEAEARHSKFVGGTAKLSIKANLKNTMGDDPFQVVKGGVDSPSSPTQRNYFKNDTMNVEGGEHVRVYRVLMPGADGKMEPSSNARHFCIKCGTHLWAYDKSWSQWVYPFAGAIDTDLPKPPNTVHMMLGSKASWVEPQVHKGDKEYEEYPELGIEEWHKKNGVYIE